MPIRATNKHLTKKIVIDLNTWESTYSLHLLMMNAVNMFVKPFCMQNPVSPIEHKILKDEVKYNLR